VSPLDKPFVLLGQTHYIINKICLYKKKEKKRKKKKKGVRIREVSVLERCLY
jgi:hypothetical protein